MLNLLLHDLQVQVSDWEQLPSGEGRESDQEGEIKNVQGWLFVDCMREARDDPDTWASGGSRGGGGGRLPPPSRAGRTLSCRGAWALYVACLL